MFDPAGQEDEWSSGQNLQLCQLGAVRHVHRGQAAGRIAQGLQRVRRGWLQQGPLRYGTSNGNPRVRHQLEHLSMMSDGTPVGTSQTWIKTYKNEVPMAELNEER